MGNKIEVKLIILSVVFLITSILVYWNTKPTKVKQKPALKPYFKRIDGYEMVRQIELSKAHVNMLKLDDYIFADYAGKSGSVNLYIGYYYASSKAYAAHSPMVCYPSQGWKINWKPEKKAMTVGGHEINYEEIITSSGEERELVLYWYQSRLLTNTAVYLNKIDMAYNKLTNNDEQHAFVRVAVPMGNSSYEEAKRRAEDFIRAFYPNFIRFIEE